MKRNFLINASVIFGLAMPTAMAIAAPIDDLKAHLDVFVRNNFNGQMTFELKEEETISQSSDLRALSSLISDNFWVTNQTAVGSSNIQATKYVQLSGVGTQQYIDDVLLPKMVNRALVAEVYWTWNSQSITTYALVSPGPNPVGDVENIIDGVAGFFTALVPNSGRAANPFHKGFKNGFGTHVADYDASLKCVNGDTCSGDATATDSRVGMSAKAKKEVKCLPNGNCQMQVAFSGTGGFPSVSFEADGFSFSVSGFGWEYYNASITLDEPCECTPEKIGDQKKIDHHQHRSTADVNGDGIVDYTDVITFVKAFEDQLVNADFNGDNVLDALDVSAFLYLYNSARP